MHGLTFYSMTLSKPPLALTEKQLRSQFIANQAYYPKDSTRTIGY